jgi:hypothetical protein
VTNLPFTISMMADLATALGVPLGLGAIAASYIAARKSTDIQTVTTLSIHFQNKWESRWRELCRKNVPIGKMRTKAQKDDLRDALNWIDWLGVLVERKSFADPVLVLKSIEAAVKSLIELGLDEINAEGRTVWPGIFEVAKWLNMPIKGEKILYS